MTEEPKFDETTTSTTTEETKTERNIADELARLGQQLSAAAKSAWESEERKRLQGEIMNGVQRAGQEINAAVNKASEHEQVQQLRTKAVKVAEDVQKTDVADEIRKGILVGLQAINREMGKLLERLESKPGETEVGPVTDTTGGETYIVAETPVVPDMASDTPMSSTDVTSDTPLDGPTE